MKGNTVKDFSHFALAKINFCHRLAETKRSAIYQHIIHFNFYQPI